MKPKQEKCLALMVAGGQTQKEIAQQLNVTEATICNWKKDPVFQAELQAALRAGTREAAAQALKVEVELLKSKNKWVRLEAARDILNRAGIKADDLGVAVAAAPVVVISGADQLLD